MTPPTLATARTYLRIGAGVYPVYGDELRGWSLRAEDFESVLAASPYLYRSIEELFFALVNLWAQATGAERRASGEIAQ
jgi:hypothetical protein